MKVWRRARFFWCDEACDYKWEGLRLRTGDASVLCCCGALNQSANEEVQMRLQLSDVCGEGRVVAGASGYELNVRASLLRCTAASMMWTQ